MPARSQVHGGEVGPDGFEPGPESGGKGRRTVWSSSCWDGTTFCSWRYLNASAVLSDTDIPPWRNGESRRVRSTVRKSCQSGAAPWKALAHGEIRGPQGGELWREKKNPPSVSFAKGTGLK